MSFKHSLPLRLFLSFFCASLIGFFDFQIGAEIHASILYLLPVVFIAWCGSTLEGLFLLSFISSISLGVAIGRGEFQGQPFVPLFNGFLDLAVIGLALFAVSRAKYLLEKERRASKVDFLTGLLNRRAFCESMKREANRCRREGKPLTIAFLDCDNFKEMNDRHGHKTGDKILRTVGQTLKKNLRTWDLTARFGGDEFVLVLPATEENLAHSVLERTRRDLLDAMEKSGWKVTFSVGAVTYLEMSSVEKMLDSADNLMYEVKHATKNRLKHTVVE
jgi:diguanylate cyclase (GGDEF)-like protein